MPLYPEDDYINPKRPTNPPGVPTPTPYHLSFKSPAQSPRPFIRVGNICIAVARIVSVEFLPDAVVYKVGDGVFYGMDSAERAKIEGTTSLEPTNAPVVVVNYINSNDMREFIRRWGDEAEEVWNYVISNLALP